MDSHRLQNAEAEAGISSLGAELQRLCLQGQDVLWAGGDLWPRRAPLLFPIIGRLKEDLLRHEGGTFRLTQHGFARDRSFTWREKSPSTCRLELRDDEATRSVYPFPFLLEVRYTLRGAALETALRLTNPGPGPLPASLGGHPAFRWPLAPGCPKQAHRLVFAEAEPHPVRRLAGGLLAAGAIPSPIRSRVLELDERLFAEDALIFDRLISRSLRFEARNGPALTFTWEGFPHFALWAKPVPGPAFLCLEPWQGHASPEGWEGEFMDKPGGVILAPGESRTWSYAVGLGD